MDLLHPPFFIAVQGLTEFFHLAFEETPKSVRFAVYATTFVLFVCVSGGRVFLLPVVAFLWVAVPMIYSVCTYRNADFQMTGLLGKAAMGCLYIPLPLSMLIVIDRFPGGSIWIFFLLIIVFACDTGAFYVGRTFGRHKLHPLLSPGKTWEGALGGLLASLCAAVFWNLVSSLHHFDMRMLLLAGVVSVCAQMGDLAESMLKRNRGVKDSGRILPGHGGVLDRIDAHLFAIPVLFTFLVWPM